MKSTAIFNCLFDCLQKVILIAILFIPVLTFGQTRGKVEEVKDPRIDTLNARWAELNKGVTGTGLSSNGYRVQVYSGSNRQEAYDAQAKFAEKYPQMRTYISYHEPYFKVHAGDFRTRLEAEKLKQDISPWFSSIFIIPEKINPPKADANND